MVLTIILLLEFSKKISFSLGRVRDREDLLPISLPAKSSKWDKLEHQREKCQISVQYQRNEIDVFLVNDKSINIDFQE
jgi:predicted NAD/FAD-binding protein